MLLQKQKTTPYTSVFKISTGEEFIASVIEETLDHFTIKKPLCLVATGTGVQFAPLLMLGDPEKTVEISRASVIITTEPSQGLESNYEQATTGIALPQKGKIIT